jgi:hypothetical protein
VQHPERYANEQAESRTSRDSTRYCFRAGKSDLRSLAIQKPNGGRCGSSESAAGERAERSSVFGREATLEPADESLVQEIFWDLVVEKVLTIGKNPANPNFPWFRLHSEASENIPEAAINLSDCHL